MRLVWDPKDWCLPIMSAAHPLQPQALIVKQITGDSGTLLPPQWSLSTVITLDHIMFPRHWVKELSKVLLRAALPSVQWMKDS